ncbi:MAG: quinolinate synthase NadA [Candidatus Lokiarchaeota archaeon]|nr:quinolinate synthase NadA [Candidatus Lokiarchaeota archaeon]
MSPNIERLKDEIQVLKQETSTIILAHYYQVTDVQDVCDFLGDSLGLSRKAAGVTNARNIVFAAVDFMAEVAKILVPSKRVFMPDRAASCPMANQLRAAEVTKHKEQFPGLPVVLYINTLAEAKAECDVICTSSNAVEVCTKVAREWHVDTILMGPDKNLAYHVEKKTGLKVISMPEKGCCYVHDQFIIEDLHLQKQRFPSAKVVVHPECRPDVQEAADFVGSTTQMLRYIEDGMGTCKEYIVGTEQGLLDHLVKKHPDLVLHSLSPVASGIACKNMKKTTLEKVRDVLLAIKAGTAADREVKVDDKVALKAKKSIDAMFTYSTASG